MKRLSKRFARTAVAGSLILAFPLVSMAALKVGDEPKLVVITFSGESFDLSHCKGKWVIVNFFASWCPGCRTEMPELEKLYEKYHPAKLDFVGLSPEPSRKRKDAEKLIREFKLPGALTSDAKVSNFDFGAALPTTYLIGPKGDLKKIFAPTETTFDAKVVDKMISGS